MNIFIGEVRRVVRRRSQTAPHAATRFLISEVGNVDPRPSGLEPGRTNDQALPLLQLRRPFARRTADISMLTAFGQLYGQVRQHFDVEELTDGWSDQTLFHRPFVSDLAATSAAQQISRSAVDGSAAVPLAGLATALLRGCEGVVELLAS